MEEDDRFQKVQGPYTLTKEAEGDDQCDAMELGSDEGDFVAVANHDSYRDKASDSQISHINNKIISNKGEEEPEIEAPSDDRQIMKSMV